MGWAVLPVGYFTCIGLWNDSKDLESFHEVIQVKR